MAPEQQPTKQPPPGDLDADIRRVEGGSSGGGPASKLRLRSPYSDQSHGALPGHWGEEVDAAEFQYAPWKMSTAEVERLQKAMWLAGYYGEESIRQQTPPRWGTFTKDDQVAWQQYLADVALYQGIDPETGEKVPGSADKPVKTADELLSERMAQFKTVHEQAAAQGAGYIEPEVVKTTDPAYIAEIARSTAKELLGRDISNDEINAVVGKISGEEVGVVTGQAAQRQAAQADQIRWKAGQGSTAGEKITDYATPPVVTGGPAGSAQQLANGLSSQFGVVMSRGYLNPSQSGGNPDAESGLSYTFTGNPREMEALRQYLESQNGDGKLVEKFEGNVPKPPVGADGKVKSAAAAAEDARKQAYEGEIRAKSHGNQVTDETVTKQKQRIKELAQASPSFLRDLSPEDKAQIKAYNENPDAFMSDHGPQIPRDQAEQTARMKGEEAYLQALGVKEGEFAWATEASAAPAGMVPMPGSTMVYVKPEVAQRLNELSSKPAQQGGADGTATFTVKFREGAGMPDVAAVGFGAEGSNSVKFLQSVAGFRGTNGPDAQWDQADGLKGRYGMSERIYRAKASGLGIDSSDTSAEAQDRVARSEVERLYAKYGDWHAVAHAWLKGETEVDNWHASNRPVEELGATRGQIDALVKGMTGATVPTIDDRFSDVWGTNGEKMGAVAGGGVIVQQDYDVQSRAKQELERQHAGEAAGYGTADAFLQFQQMIGGLDG